MNSNQKVSFVFLLVLILSSVSCQDDTDREIQTDLPTEAQQLFDTSKNLDESLFATLYSFLELSQLSESQIPGCPLKTVNLDERTITLDFDQVGDCEQEATQNRKGKIIISYFPVGEGNGWTVEFNDYHYNNFSIHGQRQYIPSGQDRFIETFEDLRIKSDKNLRTTLSGSFVHTTSKINSILSIISSSGSLTGTNPAGRSMEMSITSAKKLQALCLQSNSMIPVSGTELWQVSRADNQNVSYTISYEETEACQVEALAILPDGRRLHLNQ
ncbi:hypothetical protein [Algoriphagus sp. CAU 1675]|uniref:hypothetical protein n=1 Tax=Algoriphagus sp. CAU 1675 TaxID=3032597 RepID=UPI0023D9E5AB|nr:hypothetical protein [Algoriphagus sp. CAU 1675]MDF2157162.1 hypothetical protein [Algoriphagus sp. CAU 1675]